MKKRILLILLLWGMLTAVPILAQNVTLTLGEPDTSAFPLVHVHVQAVSANNTPLTQTELNNLRLRENGIPISDFEVRYVPVGMDILFVLDADSTLLLADVDETTRLEAVKQMIARYAMRFMSPSGLDRISIIVPDGANTGAVFLVQDATMPEAVVDALAAYDPQNLEEAGPVNQQLLDALDHAAAIKADGRYQSIFLLSEARRLSQFLDYPALTTAAQAAGIPVFVAILGPQASLEDIGNSAALADPTGGFYLHTPRPERVDTVYLRWQQTGNQPQISYRSLLRQSGMYALTMNLGQATATTVLDLRIEPPEAAIALERSVIRRVGTAVDTPLAELQPTLQPVPVQLSWPDGRARALENVVFYVNNVLQPQQTMPQPDENGRFTLDWNVQNADIGVYELAVTVRDELGFTSTAPPLIVTIAVEWPPPPTPAPVPTPTPGVVERMAVLVTLPQDSLLMALAALGLLALALVMVRGGQRYRQRTMLNQARAERRNTLQRIRQEPETAADTVEPLQLTLLWLEESLQVKQRIPVTAENVTLGREEAEGQITLPDRSVSPLHARLRWRHGRYWLYDEGSENGAFLNHERLGLSPQPLHDGDLIQLGSVSLRVELRAFVEEQEG